MTPADNLADAFADVASRREKRQAMPIVRPEQPDTAALLFDLLDDALYAGRRLREKAKRTSADRVGGVIAQSWLTIWARRLPDAEMHVRLWASTRAGVALRDSWIEHDGTRERSLDVFDGDTRDMNYVVSVRECELVNVETEAP